MGFTFEALNKLGYKLDASVSLIKKENTSAIFCTPLDEILRLVLNTSFRASYVSKFIEDSFTT